MASRARKAEATPVAHRVYWKKATDFHRLVPLALHSENSNGAGLVAIHAVISACDALTSFHLGVRSTGQAHAEVTELLARLELEGVGEKVAQVKRVLQLKNLVEYEDREITSQEALVMAQQAERILAWARKHLPAK